MVTDREDLHEQVCALSDRSARDLGKNVLQTVKVEDPAAADFNVNAHNSIGGVSIGSLVHHCKNVICDFVLIHAPPRDGRLTTGLQ
jgi:hypothetical protein